MSRARWTLALALLVASPARAQAPVGPEFRVNSFTTGIQADSSVAVTPGGDFVVVWLSTLGAPAPVTVAGQRFDANGAPHGPEFTVSDVPGGVPDVAGDGAGKYTVVWAFDTSPASDVRARRYDASGLPLGPSFIVNTFTTGRQWQPAMAVAQDGTFVVTWTSELVDGSATGVVAQRFDSGGAPVGQEFVVNSATMGYQANPDVAMDAAANFVVVWHHQDQINTTIIAGQRFDATGTRVGGEFVVNEPVAYSNPSNPHVAMAAGGPFVVAWHFNGLPVSTMARLFDATGAPQGGNILVSPFEAASAVPRFAPDGRFVVAWTQGVGYPPHSGDGSGPGIQARWFSAAGAPLTPAFRVNTSTTGRQENVALGSDGQGRIVAAWHSEHEEGPFVLNVYAQRLGLLEPKALAVDTAAGPLSDGNHVLEPGEAVDVRPSWANHAAAAATLAGTLAALTGPPGATYGITDATATYGTVPSGSTQACVDCYEVTVSAQSGRPVQHWDATAVEVINPGDDGHTRWAFHVGDSFSDVPRTNPFYRFVETLLHQGVTGGCGGNSYCPGSAVTRAQMAPFLLVALSGAGYAPRSCLPPPVFGDVPPEDPYCRWIEELARRGVVSGCGSGNYCPNDAVTREQMAVFLLRTLDRALSPPACVAGAEMFGDVPASSGFCRWVEELVRRGITVGCGGGNYCPTAPVTREQMAVFLTATFGLTLYGP